MAFLLIFDLFQINLQLYMFNIHVKNLSLSLWSNACHTVSLTHWAVYSLYLISLWRRQSPYTDSNALSVSLPVISSNFFHSISPCVCVPSPAHPYCCLAVVSAKRSSHSMLCCDIGEKCSIIIPTDYIKMSFPRVLFSEETSSTAASLWQAAVTCMSVCLSVHWPFVSQFVFLSRPVSVPVWPSICVSACLSACLCSLHAFLPASLFVSVTAECRVSPLVRCRSWGNIKKTNLRLSSCETDCFSVSQFLTMILMDGFAKNMAWNIIISCWCYEVLMSSIYPSIRTNFCCAEQSKHVKHCVHVFMWTHIYI